MPSGRRVQNPETADLCYTAASVRKVIQFAGPASAHQRCRADQNSGAVPMVIVSTIDHQPLRDVLRRRGISARDLLEALPAAIYLTDAAGHLTFYNRAAAALWGCARHSARPSGAAPGDCTGPMASPCRTGSARWRWRSSRTGRCAVPGPWPSARMVYACHSLPTRRRCATRPVR